ncbi:MAG: CARDB domain-containing protein [Candidatus Heimdallarchaeota archaeon]
MIITPPERPPEEFFEEYPAWNMPDPAVIDLAIEPDRANLGESVILRASVANLGPGCVSAAELIYRVNDVEIRREPVEPLGAGEEVEIRVSWIAEEPGRHWIVTQLEFGPDSFDRDFENNLQTGIVRVSGEAVPQPELEVEIIDLELLHLTPGESDIITLNFRNPSLTDVHNIPVEFYIDGERISEDMIEYLAPGEQLVLQFQWREVTPGEHIIEVKMDLPDEFPYANLQKAKSWHAFSSDSTILYDKLELNKWVSIGPRLLTNGEGGLTTNSTGRIYHLAFHPKDPNTIYAGGPTCGLWKTTNGGDSWFPLTDKLATLSIGCIAVDQINPKIIYFGTGSSFYGGGIGIYKSVDGGATWTLFATKYGNTKLNGVSKLVIRYPSPGQVLIYAATNKGVLRYTSNYPWAKKSSPNDWTRIKTGKVIDLVVDPKNDSWVYASVAKEGMCRTSKGQTATSDTDWIKELVPQTFTSSTGNWYTFDIFWGPPRLVLAAIKNPNSSYTLGIYKSVNDGDAWSDAYMSTKGGLYNPFLRVYPNNKDLVYYSGVNLYKRDIVSKKETLIKDIHDDMHAMEWDPYNPSRYYVGTDGGIWHCTINTEADVTDSSTHRNKDLRVTMFYDFDTSQTNSKLKIGGTQDCGTILYQGNPDWKFIKSGDGYYSLIAPGNQVFYAQHQGLTDTARCDKGVNCWINTWTPANGHPLNPLPTGFDMRNSYITVHPNDANTLLAQGNEVYLTTDGGKIWKPIGPSGKNVPINSKIKRVVIQPKTFTWYAGNSQGQIWYRKAGTWYLGSSHPDKGAYVTYMVFAPTNHKVLYVTYAGCDPYRRIERFEVQTDGSIGISTYIAGNLPTKHISTGTKVKINAIAVDGYSDLVVYIGTDHGIFQGKAPPSCPACMWTWKPYNDGFPLVIVYDLLVDPTSKELRAATFGRGAWTVMTGTSGSPGLFSRLELEKSLGLEGGIPQDMQCIGAYLSSQYHEPSLFLQNVTLIPSESGSILCNPAESPLQRSRWYHQRS